MVSCSTGLTVPITINVSAPNLGAAADSAPDGRIQGYVYTPDPDSDQTGVGTSPRVTQTPIPPAGFRVPVVSVLVAPQASTTGVRLDQNGFFVFRGQAVNAPPAPVRVDFAGGGFSDFVTEVPIVTVDMEGWDVRQVDLQSNAQYSNNAQDIRAMQSVTMNLRVTAAETALIEMYVSGRGDLEREDLGVHPEAYQLIETNLSAGETRPLLDVKPLRSDKLLELANPGSGNEMLWLYLLSEEPQNPAEGAAANINSIELVFKALVGAPL
jgi:hypothetical protein